jgi:hypothetical protein
MTYMEAMIGYYEWLTVKDVTDITVLSQDLC